MKSRWFGAGRSVTLEERCVRGINSGKRHSVKDGGLEAEKLIPDVGLRRAQWCRKRNLESAKKSAGEFKSEDRKFVDIASLCPFQIDPPKAVLNYSLFIINFSFLWGVYNEQIIDRRFKSAEQAGTGAS